MDEREHRPLCLVKHIAANPHIMKIHPIMLQLIFAARRDPFINDNIRRMAEKTRKCRIKE